MKSIIGTLSQHKTMIMFPIIFLWKKKKGNLFLLLFLFIFTLTGCFTYFYKSGTIKGIDAATIKKLQSEHKYFILHAKDGTVAMNNIKIKNDQVEADLGELPPEHIRYLSPKTDKSNAVKASHRRLTFLEVHMYYPDTIDSTNAHFSAPSSSFDRVDIYEYDPATTTVNHVLSGVGIIFGAFAFLGLIVLISCNCPQVYVDNGTNYEFVSGVYSGSIYASMERTDYLPLPTLQTINECKLKIANVKNEEQYINQMQLMKVHHSEGVSVLADRHGKVFTWSTPQAPFSASINTSTEVKKIIAVKDKDFYSFNNAANENGFSSLTLQFNKPADAQKAKLLVHGGNSLWSGYIYHRFAEMFGNKYEAWRNQKDTSNPKEMEQWQKEQALPLMVYINKSGKWEPVDYFPHTGNTATRDMIMELDVSDIKNDQIKIKLESAFQFWDLDYAAIDFSANEETTATFINASSVIKTGMGDQKVLLKEKDDQYCQLQRDEELNLVFSLAGNARTDSYFLVSTGYYHNTQRYDNIPDLKTLNSFKSKRSFDVYSRLQFTAIEQSLSQATFTRPSASRK